MYYYFDDKRDLFITVVEDSAQRLFQIIEAVGEVAGVEAFWARVEVLVQSGWTNMLAEPRLATLLPALLDPRNATDVPEAMATMNERLVGWVQEFLGRGRAVGAVRDDLPDDLLVAVTFAVGEAMDRWVARRWVAEGKSTEGASIDGASIEGASSEETSIEGASSKASAAEPSAESVETAVDLLRRLLTPA